MAGRTRAEVGGRREVQRRSGSMRQDICGESPNRPIGRRHRRVALLVVLSTREALDNGGRGAPRARGRAPQDCLALDHREAKLVSQNLELVESAHVESVHDSQDSWDCTRHGEAKAVK